MKMFFLTLILIPLQCFCVTSVEKFKYDAHDYLCFDGNHIVHDPECYRCLKRKYVLYNPRNPFSDPVVMENLSTSKLALYFIDLMIPIDWN